MNEHNEMARFPRQYADLIQVIGLEATVKLCNEYGGMNIYIPKADGIIFAKRRDTIMKEYNGYNIAKLAKKYGLSVRAVQMIVHGQRPPELDGQMSMQDFC